MECLKCKKEFTAENVLCEICSEDRGEPSYHIKSDKCKECQK